MKFWKPSDGISPNWTIKPVDISGDSVLGLLAGSAGDQPYQQVKAFAQSRGTCTKRDWTEAEHIVVVFSLIPLKPVDQVKIGRRDLRMLAKLH